MSIEYSLKECIIVTGTLESQVTPSFQVCSWLQGVKFWTDIQVYCLVIWPKDCWAKPFCCRLKYIVICLQVVKNCNIKGFFLVDLNNIPFEVTNLFKLLWSFYQALAKSSKWERKLWTVLSALVAAPQNLWLVRKKRKKWKQGKNPGGGSMDVVDERLAPENKSWCLSVMVDCAQQSQVRKVKWQLPP